MTQPAAGSTALLGGLAQIGKYFQIVSILPATLVVLTIYALLASGAPGKHPSWRAMVDGLAGIQLNGAAILAVVIVLLGMTIHPFQRAATQFLEGYWPPNALGRIGMSTRARIHLQRRNDYGDGMFLADKDFVRAREAIEQTPLGDERNRLQAESLDAHLEMVARRARMNRYPEDSYRVMPTHLGNVLRRYEDLAGRPYDRDAVGETSHLMYLAPVEHAAMVDDARTDLDLAVRFVISWLIIATISFLILWPYGGWLGVPVGAYAMVWLSYRAAVHAAEEYGHTLLVLFALNHHLLDEHLPLPPPARKTFELG